MASPDKWHLADVLKQLKYYMNKRRRENGFDTSGPEKMEGEYSAFTGGSYYFNYHQDKKLQMILESYANHCQGKESGLIDDLLASRPILGRVKGYLEPTTHHEIEYHLQNESARLVISVAQLVLNESGLPLNHLKNKSSHERNKHFIKKQISDAMFSTPEKYSIAPTSSAKDTIIKENKKSKFTSMFPRTYNTAVPNSCPQLPYAPYPRKKEIK